MSKVRIVFLGTPDFAVLPLESMAKDDHFEIVEVITQPDKPRGRHMQVVGSPVKLAAEKLDLPVVTTGSVNTTDFIQHLKTLKADVAVVIAFGQIVSQEFLNVFPYKAVNVHGSLLPRWRGAAPIQRAIEHGDQETGVTLQIMVKELDAGPILGARKILIKPEDTASSIYEKLKKLSCELLHIELMDYVRGNLSGVKQEESQITVAKKIKKEEGLIQWQKSAIQILNQIRAFDAWPGSWTYWKGKQLKIYKSQVTQARGKPGEILSVDKDGVVVGCGEGSLKLLEVQLEGKNRTDIASFLRGYDIKKGDTFQND